MQFNYSKAIVFIHVNFILDCWTVKTTTMQEWEYVTGERRSLEAQQQSSREIKEALIRTSTQLEQTYIRSRDEQSQIQHLQQVVKSQRDLVKELSARLVAANVPLTPALVANIHSCLEDDWSVAAIIELRQTGANLPVTECYNGSLLVLSSVFFFSSES